MHDLDRLCTQFEVFGRKWQFSVKTVCRMQKSTYCFSSFYGDCPHFEMYRSVPASRSGPPNSTGLAVRVQGFEMDPGRTGPDQTFNRFSDSMDTIHVPRMLVRKKIQAHTSVRRNQQQRAGSLRSACIAKSGLTVRASRKLSFDFEPLLLLEF